MIRFPTPLWRLSLLLTLLAGCQSTRSSFSFRPPASAPRLAVAASLAPPPAGERRPEARPPRASDLARPAQPRAAQGLPITRLRLWRRVAALAASSPTSRQADRPHANFRPARPARLRARPASAAAGVAESGLGTTFIGILGIVALLVGLVGLLIAGWGFFGWLAVGGAVALLISILAPYFGW